MVSNSGRHFDKRLQGDLMTEQLNNFVIKAIDEALANVHTITIVKIVSVGSTTLECKPVIARVVGEDAKPLPTFLEVPPVFMRGAGTYTAHPVAVGDYGLLLITERCFDKWYGGVENESPNIYRMHDYSDGFVLVGIAPAGGAIVIPTDAIETFGDQNLTGDQVLIGNHTMTGDSTITGNQTITGDVTITGDLIVNGINFSTHVHGGVQGGAGNTGVPS